MQFHHIGSISSQVLQPGGHMRDFTGTRNKDQCVGFRVRGQRAGMRVCGKPGKFIQESARLIAPLPSSVQREVYGGRVAESAGISMDAMKLEIGKAYKRRIAREKKQQEKIDLAPAQALQPKTRSVRYDNMKSAMAEEGILAQILREPALLDECRNLKGSDFSVPLLGKVYDDRVYDPSGHYAGTIVRDRVVYRSTHSARFD